MDFMGNQSQNYRIDYGAKRLLQEKEKRFFYRTHDICPLAMQLIPLINNYDELLFNLVNMRFK